MFWGSTFVSSKILLDSFTPIELLFIRFLIGFLTLCILSPKILKLENRKDEIWYILSGLTGVFLYYFIESTALVYTYATNVGVIISIAPFFTSILAYLCFKDEPFKMNFVVGFIVAFIGIFFISFNGQQMHLSPKGDILTIVAAIMWAIYSVVLKKVNELGHTSIQNTKRIFAWGLFFMTISLPILGFDVSMDEILIPLNLLNLLFLGVVACAGCFVIWNYSCSILGSVRTNQYVYLNSIATIIFSVIILHEKITPCIVLGTILTLFCNLAIFNILIHIDHRLFFRNIYGQNSFIFYTTFTPTNRYGSCRIPNGNGPEGSIAVNGIPFPLAFSFKTETRTTSL